MRAVSKSSEHKLPPAEMEVLACLHRHGTATARELRESIAPYRPMTHGSIVTLLKRLEAKKLVSKEKGPIGKAFLYRPVRQPHTTLGGAVRRLVQRVFHGDSVALVASLFETKAPTRQEVDKLQELVDELRRAKGKKRPE